MMMPVWMISIIVYDVKNSTVQNKNQEGKSKHVCTWLKKHGMALKGDNGKAI